MDEGHSIASALAAFAAHPLSRKRAMLAALLIDAELDRRLAVAGGDILATRAALAARAPALALVMGLASLGENGPRLVLDAVDVTPQEYPALSEGDYMVSLYNDATVPRVRLAAPDGSRHDALALFHDALAELATTGT